jgi:small-conductance mechanosensitive channel
MFDAWPWWAMPLLRSAITIGIAVGLGHIVRAVFRSRMAGLAARSAVQWDDILVVELSRRIPFWSILIGLWLALPHWPLLPQTHTFLTRLLSALGVWSVTMAAAAIATGLVRAYGPRASPTAPVSGLSQAIVRIFVIVLGTLVIIRSFGYDITPMLTALGVGGLAVALGLQQPLANLFAGLFVSFAGQIRIGDYVRLEMGAEGFVADFNWHSMQILSPTGNLIVVPNARVAQVVATNFSHPQKDMATTVELGVDYKSDLDRVERVTVDVARKVMREVPGGVPDFEPSIRYAALSDVSVRLQVNLRVREFADQSLVKHEFIRRVHARYREEGIVIPHPQLVPVPPPAPPAAIDR